ncbi:MAG TPA: FtsX-like permease family protein [Streptosporangiaceae bacterium]|jgi:putative ABC transport system permease protein
MGRIHLVARLALRDIGRRRTEAALLLIAILAATTTLTLGLVLRDAAGDPYQSTRAATKGPDVVAGVAKAADLGRLEKLATASGVTGHSGPYPVVAGKLAASGRTSDVQVEGRDSAAAAVDQPAVTRGHWVRNGGVVLEAAFANSLDVGVGDSVTLSGRSFTIAGVAATAAMPPYPGSSCIVSTGCVNGAIPRNQNLPTGLLHNPGLVWLTQADVRSLASARNPLSYVTDLKLADPNTAQAFVNRNGGDWLLGLLAMASLSVLVGGRMADQTRRVGLLKAVGGTPGLVAAVLLAEYLLVAVVAAAAGPAIGALAAPLLTDSSAGLVSSAGTAPLSWSTIGVVTAVALGVAVVATAVPAVRAARSSTVSALADAARPPRRTGWLIALSRRLPVPLLLALRVTARRPRRVVLVVALLTAIPARLGTRRPITETLQSEAA